MLTHPAPYFHSVRSKAKTHLPLGLTNASRRGAKISSVSGASFRKRCSRFYLDSFLARKSKTFAKRAKLQVFCCSRAIKRHAINSTLRLSKGKLGRNAAKQAEVFFS